MNLERIVSRTQSNHQKARENSPSPTGGESRDAYRVMMKSNINKDDGKLHTNYCASGISSRFFAPWDILSNVPVLVLAGASFVAIYGIEGNYDCDCLNKTTMSGEHREPTRHKGYEEREAMLC
jgi:hypothetical protein